MNKRNKPMKQLVIRKQQTDLEKSQIKIPKIVYLVI